MHRIGSVIELALMKDDHAVIQIDAGIDRFLYFRAARSRVDPVKLRRPRIDIATICGAHWALAVIDQCHVVGRCVCVFHIVECR